MSAIGEWIHLILILMMIAAEPLTKATYETVSERNVIYPLESETLFDFRVNGGVLLDPE